VTEEPAPDPQRLRLERTRSVSLAGPHVVPLEELRARFDAVRSLAIGDRIASWASFFLERNEAVYVFGDAPGGYVHEGRLIDDRATDCVLFSSRVVELATSDSPEEAVDRALSLRFPGCPLDEILAEHGVDFAHPSRLRYGEDMIASGGYGADVTSTVGELSLDPGTGRARHGAIAFVRSNAVRTGALRNGDLAFFVLDPEHGGARRVREETGATIGHMGIVRTPAGRETQLVHAALRALPGEYEGNRIVTVALETYLARVDRFSGMIVTRLDDGETLTSPRRTREARRSTTS
jgi:hypothetical protein